MPKSIKNLKIAGKKINASKMKALANYFLQ